MIGPLTYLDAALIAVALLSGLLAMYRGFTREVVTILSWALAAGAVLYFILNHKKEAEQLATQLHAPVQVSQVAIGGVIFLVVLVIVHLLTMRISDSILDSRVGMIDRVAGFAFGALRGFILIVIPYMFYANVVPDVKNQVDWVRDSKSLPWIQSTGNTFKSVLIRVVPSSLTKPAAGEQAG